MKTKVISILIFTLFLIVGGISFGSNFHHEKFFGDTPEQPATLQSDSASCVELIPLAPLIPWTVNIQVDHGPNWPCLPLNCIMHILIEPATDQCVAFAPPGYTIDYDGTTSDFSRQIPGTVACVIIRFVDDNNCFGGSFVEQDCCECRNNNNVCKFTACP